MKLQPLFDRVLVLPIPEGNLTKGGLLVPDVAQRSKIFAYGDVIAIGTGRVNIEGKVCPLTVKVGDVVSYARKAGVLVPVTDDEGEEIAHVLLREPEIFAIVEGLPRSTGLTGLDGRLLTMVPTSRGLPDVVFQNREELEVAEREGWTDGEIIKDEFEPGDGPAELSP